jgi:hypothetical protein
MNQFAILEQFMINNPDVARGNLSGYDGQIVHQEKLVDIDGLGIYKISKFDPHIGLIGSTSLNPALWNREFLLEFIEDDWPLDKIEIPGNIKFQNQSKWYSIGTVPSLLESSHLCYTSQQNVVRLSEVNDEDKHLITIPDGFEID